MSEFFAEYGALLLKGTWVSIYATALSTFFSYLFGLPLGILLVVSQPNGIWPRRTLYTAAGWIINMGRSIPFIILLIALMPFTRFVTGSAIGPNSIIVPLVIAATPFVARMVENSIQEVDAGVIEVAQSTGCSVLQIVWKVILPESRPALVLGASISYITILGYHAMAGLVGGGGLGDVAIRYGFYRFRNDLAVDTIIILIILVQIIQMLGNGISRKIDKRIRK